MVAKVTVKKLIDRIHGTISSNDKFRQVHTIIEPKAGSLVLKHSFVLSHADAASLLGKESVDHRDTALVERHLVADFKDFSRNVHVTTGEHSFNVTMITSHPFDSFTNVDAERLRDIDAYAQLMRNIRDKSIEPGHPLYRFFIPLMSTQTNIAMPQVKLDKVKDSERFEMTVGLTNKETEFPHHRNLRLLKESVKASLAEQGLTGDVKIEKFIRNEPTVIDRDALRVLITYPCEQKLLNAVAPFSQIKDHLKYFEDTHHRVSVAEIDHWMK